MLNIKNVHFGYKDKTILKELSFTLREGEIVALIGSSGCGKTTLFRIISGLLAPAIGEILIWGERCRERASFITYMRQEDLLLPWRTVLENLLLFSELGPHNKKKELLGNARLLLHKVGLEKYENYYPKALSGGMRQRVSLARALLQERPLILLDEPFASLDVILREQLYTLLREIRDQLNKTIMLVTHDFRDALSLADRILILAQGSIVADYTLNSSTNNGQNKESLIQAIRNHLLSCS